MDLEQWSVGGRGFGTILVFVLMAGEIYTTFTFLGGSGFAYGHGAPAYLHSVLRLPGLCRSYWLLPPIWRYAKQHRLFAQPDFFARKYDSPALGVLVAVVGIVALVPYWCCSSKGWASSSTPPPMARSRRLGDLDRRRGRYRLRDGLRRARLRLDGGGEGHTDPGRGAVPGDLLPIHYYGGIGAMFAAIQPAKPGFLALPAQGESVCVVRLHGAADGAGLLHVAAHLRVAVHRARRSARSAAMRRLLPLYQLILLFVFFVGFAAILQVPGLKGPDIDLSLLRLSIQTFDPWFVGVIGAAGVLTALVPGSMILMAAATLLANTLFRSVRPQATDAPLRRVAKCWCRWWR